MTVRRTAVRHFTLLAISAVGLSASAKDSAWLLCDDGKHVVNVYEHRNQTGDGRVTDLTFIFGSYLLKGRLVNTDSGPVSLRENSSRFRGTVTVNYAKDNLKLVGDLNLTQGVEKLESELKCKRIGE